MRIGIDFDRVLFRTDAFKSYLETEIPGFLKHYSDNKDEYELEPTEENLGVQLSELLSRIDQLRDFVIDDIDQLTELADHELILVSRGPHWFQKTKIVNSRVVNYMNEVVIVRTESKDMADIDLLIDDSKSELDRSNAAGFHFDQDKHNVHDIIAFVQEHQIHA